MRIALGADYIGKSFGPSAPLKALMKHSGFTAERIANAAKEQILTERSDLKERS